MNANTGGPAFPIPPFGTGDPRDGLSTSWEGMTLRDWFAGNEQLVDCVEISVPACEALAGKRPDGTWKDNPIALIEWEAAWRARIRYIRADAMLKAREAKL